MKPPSELIGEALIPLGKVVQMPGVDSEVTVAWLKLRHLFTQQLDREAEQRCAEVQHGSG